MSTDYRALCAELADALHSHTSLYEGHESELVARARAALAQPEPEGASDEDWEALKERLWHQYETCGYQGERFIYDSDFYTALDVVRQELARFGHPAIKPVPVTERPALAEQAYVAFVQICKGNSDDAGTYDADEELVRRALKKLRDLECNALPLPTPAP